MKLYSMVPFDCSGKVNWLLNELGVDFELETLSWKNGDLASEKYLKMNPIGQIPVLEDSETGVVMFESYAIVSYLADKYIEKGLAPDFSQSKERAAYYQWMQFSTSTAGSFFDRYFKLDVMTAEYKTDWEEYIRAKVQMVLKAIDNQLEGKEFILGNFSAVDVCLGDTLYTVSEESFFKDYPNVSHYFERLKKREAAIKSKIFSTPS
ncbi:MAG: glutathione S-transferase family protein [Halobacteriovoraceae bacterium]|nr:glutathione S-transferase family protein [Halobacteriovoraceae bacterium]